MQNQPKNTLDEIKAVLSAAKSQFEAHCLWLSVAIRVSHLSLEDKENLCIFLAAENQRLAG